MGFDIMDLQRGRGTVQTRSRAGEGRAVLKYIDVEDLVPSEDNFYSMSDIDELAGLIELSGGVKQPGLVVPLGGGKYKLLSGHRRRLASLQLVRQGKEDYRKMPCMVEGAGPDVEGDDGAKELRAIDEAILLITTNSQREKTDWDKVQEVVRLRALLDRKRHFEKISGQTRKIVAEQLGTTPAQVGRYDSIDKHLIPAFKDCLERGGIGISVAYELSILPADVQERAAEEWQERRGPVSLEDVRRWKLSAERENTGAVDVPPQPPAGGVAGEEPELPGRVTMVVEDESGPVPTAEQWEALKERVDAAKADGKVVEFPAPPPHTPEIKAVPGPEKEALSRRQAANALEDLQMFCEEMLAIDDQTETWMERSDALAVAIAVLRK